MAHSLEVRVPLADVELLRRIAPLLCLTNRPAKRDMARTPLNPLPDEIVHRGKTGFAIPVREWLMEGQTYRHERGLRKWARVVYAAATAEHATSAPPWWRRTAVRYFLRRPHPRASLSIEQLFATIGRHLPAPIEAGAKVMPFFSTGVLPRIGNLLWTWRNRGLINHVTGDVHYAALGLPRSRTILTIHDCGSVLAEENPIRRLLLRWLWFTLPVWWARYITVISEQTRKDLIELTGCPQEKIIFIPDCVDPHFTARGKTFNGSKPRILQIGAWKNKNVARLAAALKDIPCHLHIVGVLDNQVEQTLRDNDIEYSLSSQISIDQLLNEYSQADLVTFASTYEGFGLPIVEAQAVGRPLITSDISPMREVAGGGALLVDPFSVASIRDGVLEIIHNDARREEIIAKGFVNVRQYSAEHIADRYAELYERIASCQAGVVQIARAGPVKN
jgi:glycosyltransferase involved in cell wall biosynthesis